MEYDKALEYVHSLERFGIKPGLERIGELCSRLGDPHKKRRFIHVAGTNGKGSTCSLIASALSADGRKVGLYTSPYVIDFRERIQYCGEMISPEEFAEAAEKVKFTSEKYDIAVTEFEAVTAAAFLYYAGKDCDYVVLETGLGGRFDATNIIPAPEVCALTSISLDHVNILGDTVEAIAGEKCGIIKPGSKVVTYPLQDERALGVIREACEKKGVSLSVPPLDSLKVISSDFTGSRVSYMGAEYSLPLPGEHMVYNSVLAFSALKALCPDIPDESISAGFAKTVMPARFELLCESPAVILDGGHNEGCAAALKNYIDKYLPGKEIIMVSSLMADKDYETYVSLVAPYAKTFIATKADVPRALPSGELALCASKYCGECFDEPEPLSAVNKALQKANENDVVLICGSFYLAGDVREELLKRRNNQ